MTRAGVKRAIIAGELTTPRPRANGRGSTTSAASPASRRASPRLDNLGFFAASTLWDVTKALARARLSSDLGATAQALTTAANGATSLKASLMTPPPFKRIRQVGRSGLRRRGRRSDAVGVSAKPRTLLTPSVIGFTAGTEDRRGMVFTTCWALYAARPLSARSGPVGGGFSVAERQGFLRRPQT